MKRTALIIALALAGCTSMDPHYVRPDPAVPPSWPAGDPYLRQAEAALPAITYRDIFHDPRLQALIARALVNNRDLMIAAANIRAARAQYRIQRAELLPQVGLSVGASDSGPSNPATSGSSTGTGAGTGSGTGTSTASSSNGHLSADLGVTGFELDLFGRIQSLTRAQLQLYLATEAGARATRLTLVANIANAWLNYAADTSLLRIAEETAASAERSVRLTRSRLEGGIAPRTDLLQAEQVLETARASLANQRTALAQDVNLLQLLVGAPVDTEMLPQSIDQAAATVAELPAGIDSWVLLRRPDVIQAEYQLRAANAEIGAARAALFPRISLTGLLGFASSALATLFTGGAFAWSAASGATLPILDGGAGRANVRLTEAQRDAAIATYQQTIQTAFREVSDALARRGTIAELLRAQQANVEAASDSYRLEDARYREGIDPYLNLLDSQRSLFAARQNLVASRLVAASNLVNLYQVLGGDSLYPAEGAGAVPAPAPAQRSSAPAA